QCGARKSRWWPPQHAVMGGGVVLGHAVLGDQLGPFVPDEHNDRSPGGDKQDCPHTISDCDGDKCERPPLRLCPVVVAPKRVALALAGFQAADAVACAIPLPILKADLDRLGCPERLQRALPVIKAASAV